MAFEIPGQERLSSDICTLAAQVIYAFPGWSLKGDS